MTNQSAKLALVAGGGGFIGGHLAASLLRRGYRVRCVDVKPTKDWEQLHVGAQNLSLDLSDIGACRVACQGVDEVYNLACDMGGIGFIENVARTVSDYELIWVTILIMGLLGLLFDLAMRWVISRTIPWRGKG